ncbi:MAG: PAS domain-containing protein [Anaerolineae bacterium]|nr:PAS domain-containing protein [Anaerolineae bacterium]
MSEFLIVILLILLGGIAYAYYQQSLTLRRLKNSYTQVNKTESNLADEKIKLAEDVTHKHEELAKEKERSHNLSAQIETNRKEIDQLKSQIALTEQDSKQSWTLFSTIASVAYDVVFVLDEDLTVIALNRAAEAVFEGRNALGSPITEIVDVPEFGTILTGAMGLGSDETFEEQLSYNGQHYKVRTRVMPYQDGKCFLGVAMQNITQLVRLNRSRRDMVANISHELRTPIATIRLKIDSLFESDERIKRKTSIQTLKDISTQTDSLERMVQELLDLSMIESGQAIMKLVPNNLLEILEDAAERLHEQLDAKNLTVVTHVPEGYEVLADRDHIRRVFVNLISNAIKFSPEGEAITVSAQARNEEIEISVFDNGPGVPDDQRERIFERFYQVDTARTKREGSGLGLALCKHIVEHHGGNIWAQGNSQGSGGRFLFTLLNASPIEPQQEMDHGQHDFPLNTYAVNGDEHQPNAAPDVARVQSEGEESA